MIGDAHRVDPATAPAYLYSMTPYAVTTFLGTLVLLALAMAMALAVALALPRGRDWLRATFGGNERHLIGWAWAVALVAMSGSLYFSDVLKWPPCLLCWYQRIAMYPMVLVLGVGLFRADAGVWRFALPLPIVGAIISAYHVALQYQPHLEVLQCSAGIPCTARLLLIYGFISIPVMAGAGFLLIIGLLLTVRLVRADPVGAGAPDQTGAGG